MALILILIGYMWLFIHRPFEVWPVLGDLRIERIYMVLALASWVLSGRIRYVPNPLNLAYAAFALAVLVCWSASPWSDSLKAQTAVENYCKILVFYLMLVTTVHSEGDLKKIILGFIAVNGVYVAHSFREFLAGRHVYRMGIPRMVGVDLSLADPNSFSASIVYAIPLAVPCWWILRDSKRVWRGLLTGYVALSALCVVLTGSRGGLVTLALFSLVHAMRSRRRWRLLAALILLAPLSWFLMPDHLQNRFYTLIDPSVGPANAQESAEGRSEGFWIGLDLWQEYPVTGCGPGAWLPATGRKIESHNLYGQVMGEMGALGVCTFLTLILLLGRNVHSIKSAYRVRGWEKDSLYFLADAVGLAVFLMLFLGWGAHSLFRFNWLWYGAFLVAARDLVDQRLQAEGREQADRPALIENEEPVGWTPMPS